MKAEHRKELQTNVLADKVGHMIQGAKQGPSRLAVWALVGGLALLIGGWLWHRYRISSETTQSQTWTYFEDGSKEALKVVRQLDPNSNAGKAARYQMAFENFWLHGIKMLGGNAKLAMSVLEHAEADYKKLAEECKSDPVLYPEALYALAVIEETRAIESRDHLDTALEKYKEVVKANKESAFADLGAEADRRSRESR